MSGRPSDNVEGFDAEAVAWAYRKLLDFGCYASEPGAMMGDRLNMMLMQPSTDLAPVTPASGDDAAQVAAARGLAERWNAEARAEGYGGGAVKAHELLEVMDAATGAKS